MTYTGKGPGFCRSAVLHPPMNAMVIITMVDSATTCAARIDLTRLDGRR